MIFRAKLGGGLTPLARRDARRPPLVRGYRYVDRQLVCHAYRPMVGGFEQMADGGAIAGGEQCYERWHERREAVGNDIGYDAALVT